MVIGESFVESHSVDAGKSAAEIFVHDPAADPDEALHEYDIRLRSWEDLPAADALSSDARYFGVIRRHLESWFSTCPYRMGPNWC